MYLYRLEAELEDRTVTVVALGETDLEAIEGVQVQLEKHYGGAVNVKEIALLEKRRASKGTGYVVEPPPGAAGQY
jgi:hypothetical protein